MAFGIKLIQGGVVLADGSAVHPAPINVDKGVICFLSFTGTTTSYAWSLAVQTGSHSVISSAASPGPTFTPDIDTGSYSVTLTDDNSNVYVLDIVTPTPGTSATPGQFPSLVTWYGADATGVSDCASAFTAAANAVREILVPPGTYKFTSGWTVPRAGITIKLARGAVIRTADTIITDKSQVSWRGEAFGANFNSDALSTWYPNIVWTGSTNKPVMQWGKAASVDGCSLDGVLVDGALTSGLEAYRIGTSGFGCSGIVFGVFGGIDCIYGLNVRAACEVSQYHTPFFQFRDNTHIQGTIGIMVGADAGYDGGITALTVGDQGGALFNYLTGVQLGGTAGRVTTVNVGGTGRLTIESIQTGGFKGVYVYDAFDYDITKLHSEAHGVLVTAATNASPIAITTASAHGLITGNQVNITNVLGNTAANGFWTVTVSDTTHFTLNTSTGNGTYTGGGLVTDLTHRNIVIGQGSTTPTAGHISDCYLVGAQYAIELINWDGLVIEGCDFGQEASGASGHLSYSVKVTPGGGSQKAGAFLAQKRVARGAYYASDVSSTTGFDFIFPIDKASGDETRPKLYTRGSIEGGALRNTPVTTDLVLGATAYTVNGATNASPIVLSFTGTHNLRDGDVIHVSGVGGNTNANNDWVVTYVDTTHVSLNGSTGNSAYTSGGTASIVSNFSMKYGSFIAAMSSGALPNFQLDNGSVFFLSQKASATNGNAQVGGHLIRSAYWNGSASTNFDNRWESIVNSDGASPSLADRHTFNGHIAWDIDEAGQFWLGGKAGGAKIGFGANTPEGAVTAPAGSIFLRNNGGAGTTLYVKESGSGNTGWVGK